MTKIAKKICRTAATVKLHYNRLGYNGYSFEG